MKDQVDQLTVDIFETARRGRGRPITGLAVSNADRQRAYRQRLKSGLVIKLPTVTEMLNTPGEMNQEIESLRQALDRVVRHRDELLRELHLVKNEINQLKTVTVTENQGQGGKAQIDRLQAENEKLAFFLDCHARSDMKNRKLLEEAQEQIRKLDHENWKLKQKRNVTKNPE